jgi:hypothetical protein
MQMSVKTVDKSTMVTYPLQTKIGIAILTGRIKAF